MPEKPVIPMDAGAIARAIRRIAHEIVEHNADLPSVALVGIVRRGAILAQRLSAALEQLGARQITVGTLDISSYRDDGKGVSGAPRLLGRDIPFAIDGRIIVLVDDVLYTGRTVRAGLTALAELGRPRSIQLAVLVDRGEHELPIRADYLGRNIAAPPGQRVYVRLNEVDGIDSVIVGDRRT